MTDEKGLAVIEMRCSINKHAAQEKQSKNNGTTTANKGYREPEAKGQRVPRAQAAGLMKPVL
jgi:hypothetical protein